MKQFHLAQVREIQEADRVDEVEDEGVCARAGPVRGRELVLDLGEGLIGSLDYPLPFALQAVAVVPARVPARAGDMSGW